MHLTFPAFGPVVDLFFEKNKFQRRGVLWWAEWVNVSTRLGRKRRSWRCQPQARSILLQLLLYHPSTRVSPRCLNFRYTYKQYYVFHCNWVVYGAMLIFLYHVFQDTVCGTLSATTAYFTPPSWPKEPGAPTPYQCRAVVVAISVTYLRTVTKLRLQGYCLSYTGWCNQPGQLTSVLLRRSEQTSGVASHVASHGSTPFDPRSFSVFGAPPTTSQARGVILLFRQPLTKCYLVSIRDNSRQFVPCGQPYNKCQFVFPYSVSRVYVPLIYVFWPKVDYWRGSGP